MYGIGDRPITMAVYKSIFDFAFTDFEQRGFAIRTKVYYTVPQAVGKGNSDELGNMHISCVVVKSLDTATHIPYLIYGADRASIQHKLNTVFKTDNSVELIEVDHNALNAGILREYADRTGVKLPVYTGSAYDVFCNLVREAILRYFRMVESVVNQYPQYNEWDLVSIISNCTNTNEPNPVMYKPAYSLDFVDTTGIVIRHITYRRANGGECLFELGVTPDVMRVVKNDGAF